MRPKRSTKQQSREGHELERREREYRNGRPAVEVQGRTVVKPLVGAEMPLEDVERAHELVESRRSVGKVVLLP